jgi:hypothetical protein
MEIREKADYTPSFGQFPHCESGASGSTRFRAGYSGERVMTVSSLKTQDAYVWGIVEQLYTRIHAQFPEATFAVCAHPTHWGAIIDVHVPTDDDFAVLDLVNPELDELLLAEDIAISVRVLGPPVEESIRQDDSS